MGKPQAVPVEKEVRGLSSKAPQGQSRSGFLDQAQAGVAAAALTIWTQSQRLLP